MKDYYSWLKEEKKRDGGEERTLTRHAALLLGEWPEDVLLERVDDVRAHQGEPAETAAVHHADGERGTVHLLVGKLLPNTGEEITVIGHYFISKENQRGTRIVRAKVFIYLLIFHFHIRP